MTTTRPMSNDELLTELKSLLDEAVDRVWNYAPDEDEELSSEVVDQGLLLAMKLDKILTDRQFGRGGIRDAQRYLEKAMARG
jgi:hypothetical protein